MQEVHHALPKNSFPVTTSKESVSGWGSAISPSNVGIDLNLASASLRKHVDAIKILNQYGTAQTF